MSSLLTGDVIQSLIDWGHSVRYMAAFELSDKFDIQKSELLSYDRIICYGGDGSISFLVGKLYKLGILDKCTIGCIPGGSTNDYAHSLGIPETPKEALVTALGDNILKADLGLFNGRPFIYAAAFGLFSDISYNTDQNLKNLLGHNAYILNGALSLLNITPIKALVKAKGKELHEEFVLGMITNSTQTGGFKGVSGPDVSLCDGVFEGTFLREIKDLSEIQSLPFLFGVEADGSDSRILSNIKSDEFDISFTENVKWTLDGEYGGECKEAHIEVIKSIISLAV